VASKKQPEANGIGGRAAAVNVADVVQRIQQRIEHEVKPGAAAAKGATSGGSAAPSVAVSPTASSRRITLRWRVSLDWPAELQ
jgi:hypothetical protein